MRTVRRPAVAGTFYPAQPDRLRQVVREAFTAAGPRPDGAVAPKALVVPHAGYVYSGSTAAAAYRWVEPLRDVIERVVLLGPSHHHWIPAMALPSADAFDSPLGTVPVDDEARKVALTLPRVVVDDRAHALEHSLEVQLPFLQTVLDDFSLLPIAVGDVTGAEVAAVIGELWGGSETLIVVSTDLSHYHPYDVAVERDGGTAAIIVAMKPDALDDGDACGVRPLRGLLEAAVTRALGVQQIALCNSGDTAGDRRRVVGYGAFAVA